MASSVKKLFDDDFEDTAAGLLLIFRSAMNERLRWPEIQMFRWLAGKAECVEEKPKEDKGETGKGQEYLSPGTLWLEITNFTTATKNVGSQLSDFFRSPNFFVDLVVTNWMHVHFVLMVSNQKSEAILMFELESEIW